MSAAASRRRLRGALRGLTALLLVAARVPTAGAQTPEALEPTATRSAATPIGPAAPAFDPTLGDEDLAGRVRALLAARCFACHDARKARGELRLDLRERALAGGASERPAITPGDAARSELLTRVRARDPLDRMPPDEHAPLAADDVALLARWIDDGAPWPDADAAHWAFTPPRASPPPPVRDAAWPRDPLDAFVLAKLEAAGLSPSPEADAVTLARRLSLDLVGLPPDPADVDALAADPDAYDRYVDTLLASPHFAERWGRHWLDKAGYADSDGYENDKARPEAWRWRDWVLRAVWRDMPYDRFVREQLAGDLLPDADDDARIATGFLRQTLTNTEAGVDAEEFRVDAVLDRVDLAGTALLGLTFNCARCHDHKYDPFAAREYYALAAFFDNADEAELRLPLEPAERKAFLRARERHQRALVPLQERFEAEYERYRADATRLFVLALPGADDDAVLSLAAAGAAATERELRFDVRAPDARVDGVSVELFGAARDADVLALELVVEGAQLPLERRPRTDDWATRTAYRHTEWRATTPRPAAAGAPAELRVRLRGTLEGLRVSAVRGDVDTAIPDDIRQLLALPEGRRDAYQERALTFHDALQDETLLEALRALDRGAREAPRNPTPRVPVLRERVDERRVTHVLERGDFLRPGEIVQPDTPAALPPLAHDGERATRHDLARWLTSPEHPLTARVFVNDVWLHLFGEGLVRTPGDFGTRGAPPTHPALLDTLAADVVASGWSRKALLRRIVRSSTYRQAAAQRAEAEARDPRNLLLHRQNRARVDAEVVRDQALAVAGLLSTQLGGPSVFPPLPAGVADQSYADLFTWEESAGADRYRRGLYTFFKRTAPHPHLTQFDAPRAQGACVRRERSDTPLQALVTLNDPVFVEAAAGLAARVLREADDDAARLTRAFRLCLGRAPADAERAELDALLVAARAHYTAHPDDAALLLGDAHPSAGEHGTDDEPRADTAPSDTTLAAWTATLRVLLNLDEFLVRP